MTRTSHSRGRGAALAILLACFFPVGKAVCAPFAMIHFYSTETSINNFGLLKSEYDRYLAQRGDIRFQPFKHREDFEKVLTGDNPGLCLLSSWHFQNLPLAHDFVPVLVGTVGSESIQTHGLWARTDKSSVADLKGAVIATSRTREYTQSLLQTMVGEGDRECIKSFRLLVVPKDLDALLAVSLGVADASLAADTAVARLRAIHPRQTSLLKPLCRSAPSLLPLLLVRKDDVAKYEQVIALLRNMAGDAEGRLLLNLLGLDAFALIPGEPPPIAEGASP